MLDYFVPRVIDGYLAYIFLDPSTLLTFKEADDGWVFDVSLSEQETRIS
jgi:hypothetical protein